MGRWWLRRICRGPFCIVIYNTWWHLPSKTRRKIDKLKELLHFSWDGHQFLASKAVPRPWRHRLPWRVSCSPLSRDASRVSCQDWSIKTIGSRKKRSENQHRNIDDFWIKVESIGGQNRFKMGFRNDMKRAFDPWKKKVAERYRSDPQKVVFYYSKTQIFINPPWCQIGVKIDSKWGPVIALKSKETRFWGSLKFMLILTCFLEPTRTPNGYPQKWSFCDFSVLWIQGCPKAPQRVHLGSQVGVFRFFSVCSKASEKPKSVF